MDQASQAEEADIRSYRIEGSFYSGPNNRTSELINNADPTQTVVGRNRWYEFSFNEPVYLTRIEISCDGYDRWNYFDLEVFHIDGTKHEEAIKYDEGFVSLHLGKLCSGFRFKPPSKAFSDTKIIKVEAHGFDLADFHEFEHRIKTFQSLREELSTRETKYQSLASDIDEKRQEKKDLDGEVGKSRAELERLQGQISTHQNNLEELNSTIKDVSSELATARDKRRDLLKEISTKEQHLTELVNELRLFPSEIAGFVREGGRNIKCYISISVPFIVMLGFVAYSLFSSAIDLTQLWRRENDIDIWTIFLTRIPFVVLSIALIEACSYVVGRLIYEIVRINRQRLEFAKLSIIAKDVSAAAAHDVEMSAEEIFVGETKLKMELLREHMKNRDDGEFSYRGSPLIAAIVGVAERLSNKQA